MTILERLHVRSMGFSRGKLNTLVMSIIVHQPQGSCRRTRTDLPSEMVELVEPPIATDRIKMALVESPDLESQITQLVSIL